MWAKLASCTDTATKDTTTSTYPLQVSRCLFTRTFMSLCQTGDVVLVPQKLNNISDLYLTAAEEKQETMEHNGVKEPFNNFMPGDFLDLFYCQKMHAHSALLIQLAIKIKIVYQFLLPLEL